MSFWPSRIARIVEKAQARSREPGCLGEIGLSGRGTDPREVGQNPIQDGGAGFGGPAKHRPQRAHQRIRYTDSLADLYRWQRHLNGSWDQD